MKTLSRRTLLRGTGVGIALPLLEAMIGKSSAQAQSQTAQPPRMICCYIPNGVNIKKWTPKGQGRDWELSPSLQPLAPLKEQVTCLTGLGHPRSFGGHEGADVFLTGADLNGTPGKDYANSISVDQAAASVHGLQTRIPSLELSFNSGTGSAGHSITLSFDRNGTPLPAENRPQAVFDRLFVADSASSRDAQQQRLAEDRSILDSVLDDSRALNRRLGKADRAKLDQYLNSVREVERRIQRREDWLDKPKPKVSADGLKLDASARPRGYQDYLRTIYDLIALALETDTTRIATFQMGKESNGGSFAELGIQGDQHFYSHHGGDEDMLNTLARIDHFLVEQWAYLLNRLQSTEAGDGTLLDRTMVLFGSGMNNGETGAHSPKNLPLLLAGGSKLGMKQGQHLKFESDSTPFSNLFLTMLNNMGVEADAFSDSSGTLTGLS